MRDRALEQRDRLGILALAPEREAERRGLPCERRLRALARAQRARSDFLLDPGGGGRQRDTDISLEGQNLVLKGR